MNSRFSQFEKEGEKENKNYGLVFHFLRYLSFWVSLVFVKLPFTPNQITLLANIFQFASVFLIIYMDGYDKLYGVLLYFIGDILDFVDGNIARYRKMTSNKGVFYDQIGHVVMGPLFFIAITMAAYNNTNDMVFMYMTIIVAMFVPLMSYQISVSPTYYKQKNTNASELFLNTQTKNKKLLFYAKRAIAYFYHFKLELLIIAILLNLIELLAIIATMYFVARFFIQLYLDQKQI